MADDDPGILARLAGYGWDEIHDFYNGAVNTAQEVGYGLNEVANYLGLASPVDLQHQLDNAAASGRSQSDTPAPEIPADTTPISPLEAARGARIAANADVPAPAPQTPAPDEAAPAPPLADWNTVGTRSAYAEALRTGAIQTPDDFAERYAAAQLKARGEDEPSDATHAWMGRAAGSLADALPTNDEFTDQAIAIAHASGASLEGPDAAAAVRQVKDRLAEQWAMSGKPLQDIYRQIQTDPEMARQITQPQIDPNLNWFQRMWLEGTGGENELGYNPYTKEGSPNAPTPEALQHFYFGMPYMELADEKSVKGAIEDIGLDTAAIAATWAGGKYVVAPLARMAKARLGEIPAYISSLMEKAPVNVEDVAGDVKSSNLAEVSKPVEPAREVVQAPAEGQPATTGGEPQFEPDATPAGKLEALARSDLQLGKMETRPGNEFSTGATYEHWPITRNGEEVAHAQISRTGDVAHIDNIGTGESDILGDLESANLFGPRAMRNLARQYFEANPDVNSIEGLRVPGLGKSYSSLRSVSVTRDQVMGREVAPRPSIADPEYFQKLAVDQDKPTQDLALGYDTSRGFLRYWGSQLRDLMADETGATEIPGLGINRLSAETARREEYQAGLQPRPTLPDLTTRTGRKAETNAVRVALIRFQSIQEQDTKNVNALTVKFRSVLNPHLREWEDMLKAPGDKDPTGTVIGRALDMAESGGMAAVHDPRTGKVVNTVFDQSNPLRAMFDTFRQINDTAWERAQQPLKHVSFSVPDYVNNYISHMWKDPLRDADLGFGSAGRGGARLATTKERSILTTNEGIRNGKTPAFSDPIDLVNYRIASLAAYRKRLEMDDFLFEHKHAVWSTFAPDNGWQQIPGKFRPAADDKTEYMWMPRQSAKLYNNSQSGWYQYPALADTYTKLNHFKNLFLAWDMIAPAFHGFVIGTQVVNQGLKDAATSLLHGEVGLAGKDILQTITGDKLRQYALAGLKTQRLYLEKNGDPIVQQLVEQGFTTGKRPTYYAMGRAPSLITSVNENRGAGQPVGEQIGNVFRAAGDQLHREWDQIKGDPQLGGLRRLVNAVPAVGQVGVHELSRALTTASAPLMDIAIPLLKAGVTYQTAERYLRRNLTATPEARAVQLRQIVRNIDDRFGELNQNTLLWNQLGRSIVNLAAISTSWAYGTWRWTAAALGRDIEHHVWQWNPEATGSMISEGVTLAGLSGLITYLYTGQMPHGADFAFFRNAQGNRGMVPMEGKEYLDIGKILATAWARRDPAYVLQGVFGSYVPGKIQGIVKSLWQLMVTGEDSVGHKISYTPDGMLGYLKNQFLPIIWNTATHVKKGFDFGTVGNTMFRPAPDWATNWSAFQDAQAKLAARWTKAETSRAARENAGLEHPNPDIPAPTERAKGHGRETPFQRAERLAGSNDLNERAFGERELDRLSRPRPDRNARAARPTTAETAATAVLRGRQARQLQRAKRYQRYLSRERARRIYLYRQRMVHGAVGGQEAVGGGAQGV